MDSIPGKEIKYFGLNINVEKDSDTGDVSLTRDAIQAPVIDSDGFEKGPVSAGTYGELTDNQKSEIDTAVQNATTLEEAFSSFYDLVKKWRVEKTT